MKCGTLVFSLVTMMLVLGATGFSQVAPKPIMVHYMPWFQSPYSLGAGNWGYHWTLNHFNPNLVNSITGEAKVASWYYPLIGPYDSSDPAVLEYHVLLMKLGGIDGLIVDWYGPDNYYDYEINNQRTLDILAYAQKAGLKFSLCYEDATIRAEISGGCMNGVCVSDSNSIAHAQSEMLYLQDNFFGCINYLQWQDRPVLLNFGPQYFMQSSNWESICSVLAASNQPAFFNEDNRLPVSLGTFDWPPMWLTQAPGTGGVLSDAVLQSYLAEFDHKAGSWPAYISSAFPRFHDIYQSQDGRNYLGYLGDHHGDTFRETLSRGLTNSSSIVQIVTWNDFGEGSMVEPTEEYGYRDLGIIQSLRRQYLQSDFKYQTNDLEIPLRFYHLRRQFATNTIASAELDQIFTNLVSGSLRAAETQLDQFPK